MCAIFTSCFVLLLFYHVLKENFHVLSVNFQITLNTRYNNCNQRPDMKMAHVLKRVFLERKTLLTGINVALTGIKLILSMVIVTIRGKKTGIYLIRRRK
jgi:hypothetical protein